MAGVYIRHDINNNPVSPQPKHATVSQAVSKIEYEVYNGDYVRTDVDNGSTTQPQLLDGWNARFIRNNVDNTVQTTGLSKIFVEQSKYKKHDVDNNVVPFQAYVRRDVDNNIVPTSFITKSDPEVIGRLADEDDRDNLIVTQDGLFIIQLEDNTAIGQLDVENDLLFKDESGNNRLLMETGEFISQQ